MHDGCSIRRLLPVLILLAARLAGPAQNLIQNSSLESGTNNQASLWTMFGVGSWATVSRTGGRSAALAPAPGLTPFWSSHSPIEGGRAYVVRFWVRATNALSGYCIGGFNTASRDFPKPADYWQDCSLAAWVPTNGEPYFRYGSWDMDGTSYFDDAEVLPLNAVHKRVGAYQLGEGESVAAGRYVFKAPYAGYGANYSRPLQTANASFNNSRWQMTNGTQVVYRHELGGATFSNAQVECGIYNYFNLAGTVLLVEASTNGTAWQPVGSVAATATNASLGVPASLLPASVLWIRLSGTNVAGGHYGLAHYACNADISDLRTTGSGETHHFGDFMTNSAVKIVAAETIPEGHLVTFAIPNPTATQQTFRVNAATRYATNVRTRSVSLTIPAGATQKANLLLPTAGLGNNTCLLTVQDGAGTMVCQQDLTFFTSVISDDSYGERLPAPPDAPVWWCEGGYKVGLTRALPLSTNTGVRISSARNEYEPFQLVLRPEVTLSNVTVSISDFVAVSNPAVVIPGTNVTLCRVEYVKVTQLIAGETFSVTGEHPDPLVPVTAPFIAPAETNTPLWFTVGVPKDAAAGQYQASVTISSSAGTFAVPVQLRVFGFALTDVTHTGTAYGAVLQYAWHGLQGATPAEERAVWELYMANMARHRISPYFPQWYSQIAWGYNDANQSFHPTYADFDASMERYLEEYNFTSFKDLNFYYRLPPIPEVPPLLGATINPTYRMLYPRLIQPVMQHLREKGWADRVYSGWLDEPQRPQFDLFRDGMRMIEQAAPDLTRYVAITTGLESELFGYIDRWAPLMPSIKTNNVRDRQMAGDEVWGYVALVPHPPWPNNFIDQPAINPRARAWVFESLGLTGEEYYGINHYLGTTNVWTNPMSSVDQTQPNDYYWGNGDGTLVYPPVKEYPVSPLIAGPFDSVRWEMIREAQEDREYFWSLDRVVALREKTLGVNHPAILEARAAKAAALSLVSLSPADLYPYEPEKFYFARLRLGAAIEALEDGSPFVAKEPLAKVALAGTTETLRVEAAGWPLPTIQWRHAGTNLPGATAYKLVLSNLNFSLAGDYTAVLSNAVGSVTSAVGRVTVYDASSLPVIVAQPVGRVCTNTAHVVFGVGASSVTPLTYQWYLETNPLAGATNLTLVLTNAATTNSGYYSVLVQNGAGATTSVRVPLYVVPPGAPTAPFITAQPASQIILPGQQAQLSASVVGLTPIGYQWYFNTNTPIAGATGTTLTLVNAQAGQLGTYTLRATNFAGAVTSAPALLQMATLPHYTNERPTCVFVKSGTGFRLTLPPDNRLRSVLTSTNLRDWTVLYTAAPSAMSLNVPVGGNNEPRRFFRLQATFTSPAMPAYTNQRPQFTGALLGSDYVLTLAPDNRPRSLLASTNLHDWSVFYLPAPSALPESVPAAVGNTPRQFFRLLANP